MRLPLLLSLLALVGQAAPPPLSARVFHEQKILTPDGMTKVTRFEDHLVRADNHVWQARVLPPTSPSAEAHGEDEGHLHPHDLGVAARHVWLREDGSVGLSFVHPLAKVQIACETRDFPEAGFDGSWAGAAQLLDPAALGALKPMRRKAGPGCRWYEGRSERQVVRVCWDHRRELLREMETRSLDGTRVSRIHAVPAPLPAARPWEHLEGFTRKDYVDLLD